MTMFRRRRPSSTLRLDSMECRLTPSHTVAITPLTGTVAEGSSVTLESTVTGATAPVYSRSVTKDGTPVTLPSGSVRDAATFTFTPDADAAYVVTLSVTD